MAGLFYVRRVTGNVVHLQNPAFIASFRRFTYTAFTFHHMPETLSQCGTEGETCSFHLSFTFLSPPVSSRSPYPNRWNETTPVKGARFTLDPALGKGFMHMVKGETYFRIND
jgi:hypothetical protein